MGQVSLPTMSPCVELLASSSAASAATATAAEVLLRLALGVLGATTAVAASIAETLGHASELCFVTLLSLPMDGAKCALIVSKKGLLKTGYIKRP